MVLLKAKYCVLRTITNAKYVNHPLKQVAKPCTCRAFANIANSEKNLEELPKGFDGWEPVDDVYIIDRYPIAVRSIGECLDDLRAQDKWAYCHKPELNGDRTVGISLLLDLQLQKKKKVDPFRGMVVLPHRFKADNKILCFVEPDQESEALESGAHVIGNKDVIDQILNDQFDDYDYVVASPTVMPSLLPLKNKLKRKYPKSKRGSVAMNVKTMVDQYVRGTEYKVQSNTSHVNVAIGKLSLSNSQVEENVKTVIEEVCKHKPTTAAGPMITKATITAYLLDGHCFHFDPYVPVPNEDEILEEE